jgi:uncharacterized protein YndB with AHSA1/START domain
VNLAASTLRLTRSFSASRERVFRAFTEPDLLTKWFGPPGGRAPYAEMDVRPGGSYRIAMQPPDADVVFLVGTYRDIDPPARLSFTWLWEGVDPNGALGVDESVVTLEFLDRDGSTEIVLTQELLARQEARDAHQLGWTLALDRLGELLLAGQI